MGQSGYGCCQLFGLKTKRPGLAFVDDSSLAVDQVDTVRPCGIRVLDWVAEFVQNCRHLHRKPADAHCRDGAALLFIPGAGK